MSSDLDPAPTTDRSGAGEPDLDDQHAPSWPRRIALLSLALLIGVLAAFGTRFGTDPTVVDSPLIGQPAPAFSLPLLETDGEVALGDFDGQVLVVNFWASWCVPCREETADLLTAAARYRDQDVRFLGIVYQDQPESAIDFLDELGRGYDIVTDPGSKAAIDFGVFGVPETFFIGRDGTVLAKVIGASDLELVSSTIETILAGKVPQSVSRAGYQNQRGA